MQKHIEHISAKRRSIYLKYGGRCAYCGSPLDIHQMTVDHVLPQSKGGSNSLENLMPSCRKCNTEKDSLILKDYKREKVWQSLTVSELSDMMKSYKSFYIMFTQKVKAYRFYFESPCFSKTKGKHKVPGNRQRHSNRKNSINN